MIPYFHCLPTVSVLWLLLTVPCICLRCVIVVLPDHTRLLFIGQLVRVRCLSHNRAEKDQTRRHIFALSPGPLKITLKNGTRLRLSQIFAGQFKKVWY